ncbi:MAG: HEAT repeat domain-containing protein, partial [Planctomycetota bacterium]
MRNLLRTLKRNVGFVCFVVILTLFLLMIGTVVVHGEEIVLHPCQPDDLLAIEVLVEKFDSPDVVYRLDADGCVIGVQPAFVNYALAAAKLEGAASRMTAVLSGGGPAPGQAPPALTEQRFTWQQRVAAGCALEAIGPEAIVAEPVLREMLEGPRRCKPLPSDGEIILALGVIRGIGPDAAPLLEPVRRHLTHSNFHVRYWACRALGAIGEAASDATADLCDLLESDQPASVRRNACIALGQVAGCSPD